MLVVEWLEESSPYHRARRMWTRREGSTRSKQGEGNNRPREVLVEAFSMCKSFAKLQGTGCSHSLLASMRRSGVDHVSDVQPRRLPQEERAVGKNIISHVCSQHRLTETDPIITRSRDDIHRRRWQTWSRTLPFGRRSAAHKISPLRLRSMPLGVSANRKKDFGNVNSRSLDCSHDIRRSKTQ